MFTNFFLILNNLNLTIKIHKFPIKLKNNLGIFDELNHNLSLNSLLQEINKNEFIYQKIRKAFNYNKSLFEIYLIPLQQYVITQKLYEKNFFRPSNIGNNIVQYY